MTVYDQDGAVYTNTQCQCSTPRPWPSSQTIQTFCLSVMNITRDGLDASSTTRCSFIDGEYNVHH